MQNHDQVRRQRRSTATKRRSRNTSVESPAKPPAKRVPEIYEVVIECRHEDEQRAVYERMRADGYRCRVLTL